MPNPQNRNNRRKRDDHSETLIIPHITKEMLEKARTMAAQGASRAEIEQAIAEMQRGTAPAAEPTPKPQPEPDARRIIPTSRPRYTEEERKAMLEQMRKEQEQKEAERREEATRRTERPEWKFPLPGKPHRQQMPVHPPESTENPPRTDATVQLPVQEKPEPQAPQPVQRPAETSERAAEPVRPVQEKEPTPPPQPSQPPLQQQPAPATQEHAQPPRRQAGLLHSRAEAEAELKEKIRSDHVWLSNPVMVRGLGLAPVVGAALDGERALILCVACLLLITFTRLLAVAVCHLSGNRFRPLIYCYSAAILYIPVYILLNELFGNDLTVLGIYLPILVTEPAIVKRMEFTELESLRDALRHGFNNGIGMCVALLIVGCLREFLATGEVFSHPILNAALLPLAAQPAGGFVLMGVIAAVWCAIANVYTEYKHEEVRRLYADRKR